MGNAPHKPTLLRRAAGALAGSFLLARGRRLYERNVADFSYPLSKVGKLLAGGYIILADYAGGAFPPRFTDEEETYRGELQFGKSLPGLDSALVEESELRKPFWDAAAFREYMRGHARLLELLERYQLPLDSKVLELGCGSGWMAEMLALRGYRVVGTSLRPEEIDHGSRRVAALEAKGLGGRLRFVRAPMERVDQYVAACRPFDAAFVFEALHHAHDWRATLHAARACLRPGGLFVIANEPNVLHTFIAYRGAKLTGTHEIGMSGPAMRAELRRAGFSRIDTIRPRLDDRVSAHWIAARV